MLDELLSQNESKSSPNPELSFESFPREPLNPPFMVINVLKSWEKTFRLNAEIIKSIEIIFFILNFKILILTIYQ